MTIRDEKYWLDKMVKNKGIEGEELCRLIASWKRILNEFVRIKNMGKQGSVFDSDSNIISINGELIKMIHDIDKFVKENFCISPSNETPKTYP